jgi:hypothetical protein
MAIVFRLRRSRRDFVLASAQYRALIASIVFIPSRSHLEALSR